MAKKIIALYFISVIVGVVFFGGYSYFSKSQPACANSRTCKSDLSVSIDNNAIGMFQGHEVIPPKIDLALDIFNTRNAVLGASVSAGEKHVYINLETQTLYAYQGKTQVMKTLISSGRWGRTPVGNFNVWTKLRSTRMSGGAGADYYNLPNVPYVMYFYRDFGLHGAYWHNNFGYTMSHGCVNMRIVDARDIYNWIDGPVKNQKGTAVSVCNKFIAPNTCVQENPVN
ncbi:MAG: L,D-transpeptidase [Candidatus Levybacteria bacterium]|nr:L,D-transpeptidase [Candidatus Levybacteria bacterium]